jgi:hypothetical protein
MGVLGDTGKSLDCMRRIPHCMGCMGCVGCIDLMVRGRGAKVFMVCVVCILRMTCDHARGKLQPVKYSPYEGATQRDSSCV